MNFVSIILQNEVDSYQVIVTLFLVTTYFMICPIIRYTICMNHEVTNQS